MKSLFPKNNRKSTLVVMQLFVLCLTVQAQIGTRFPSERKVVTDPETGHELIFLTHSTASDSKIYQTHNQWTSDGNWLIFRSDRVQGEAMAVNEKTGAIVQVTEGGYSGMLNVARKSMKLYFLRKISEDRFDHTMVLVVVDLASLFADSEAGTLKDKSVYQKVCGVILAEWGAHDDLALDGDEEWAWYRIGKEAAMKSIPAGTELEKSFGPRNMGAGPGGIAGINSKTGEIKHVVSVPFQVGHIQSNPWVSGQIVFCWETGGKAPQRTWIVNSDGTGLRPLYPESEYEWVTHEAVISKDEVAFAIMGHREIPEQKDTDANPGTDFKGANPGQETEWGPCGTREKPSGLAVVNTNTREVFIAGQIPYGSGFWHVSGSPDKRFLVGDNFAREVYIINRKTNEMMKLSAGHKTTAKDHIHPTFSPDGTRIQIQSAMLSEDGKAMDICVIPVPESWLEQ